MPRDETEDLAILRLTMKRLQSLENERNGHEKSGRKLDISQLENQILANIETVEKHFKHYLEVTFNFNRKLNLYNVIFIISFSLILSVI